MAIIVQFENVGLRYAAGPETPERVGFPPNHASAATHAARQAA